MKLLFIPQEHVPRSHMRKRKFPVCAAGLQPMAVAGTVGMRLSTPLLGGPGRHGVGRREKGSRREWPFILA